MKHQDYLSKKETFVILLRRLVKNCMVQFSPKVSKNPFAGLNEVVIIGMGFAANDPLDPNRVPGKSNNEIADIIAELFVLAESFRSKIHILVQREVAEALKARHPQIPINRVLKELGSESHISSNNILRQAWNYASRLNLSDAIMVAHRGHALRASWNAELYGFKVRFPHRFASSYTWNDRPSQTQWHTWNPVTFFFWDMLSRAKLLLFDRWNVTRNRA